MGHGPLDLDPITNEQSLNAALAKLDQRRRDMVSLRDNASTPDSRKVYEGACYAASAAEIDAIERALTRSDFETSKLLVASLACKVRDGDKLSPAARRFLSDAMLKMVLAPTKAGHAFGLIAPHGKQPSHEQKCANVALAVAVRRLVLKGFNVRSGMNSAFLQVSDQLGISESSVRDAYRRYRAYADFIIASEADSEDRTTECKGGTLS